MEKSVRTRLVSALVLAVVFAAGLLLGLAADTSLTATPAEETAEAADDDGEERRRTPMYEQVDPTEAQMALIDSIVTHHRASMKELHAEFREEYDPRYRALIAETREAIKDVLDPEQVVQYDSLLAEYDRRRAERRSRQDR